MPPKCPHLSPKCSTMSFNVHQMSPYVPQMSPCILQMSPTSLNVHQCASISIKYPRMSPKCPHMSPKFTSYHQILLCSLFSEARARTSVELVVVSREGRPKAGPNGFPRPVPHFSARSASEKMKQKKGKGESKSALQSQFLPRIESSFTCQKMSLLALTVAE